MIDMNNCNVKFKSDDVRRKIEFVFLSQRKKRELFDVGVS
jgi:hypothetical protein